MRSLPTFQLDRGPWTHALVRWCGWILIAWSAVSAGISHLVLYEVSVIEVFARAIFAVMGLATVAGGVLAVMGFLSGRD